MGERRFIKWECSLYHKNESLAAPGIVSCWLIAELEGRILAVAALLEPYCSPIKPFNIVFEKPWL